MSVTENQVTSRLCEFLRGQGIGARPFDTLLGGLEPDITIRSDSKLIVGEAKWKGHESDGMAEVYNYLQHPSVDSGFMIAYPLELKSRLSQSNLYRISFEEICKGLTFPVAFLTPGRGTDLRTLRINEIPSWLYGHITEEISPIVDPDQVLSILRNIVRDLTAQIEGMGNETQIFTNVIGETPQKATERVRRAARQAAAYLLLNQLLFYRILSAYNREYPPINIDGLHSPRDLTQYFRRVLDDDYAAVFSLGIVDNFSMEGLEQLKKAIRAIYGLAPQNIDKDILGKLFHRMIPLEVRKPVAAYYTLRPAADLLAALSIRSPNDYVMDPACGSGTLLASCYRVMRELQLGLTGNFTNTDHRRLLEEHLTGIDIMPFAAHLTTIHLALQEPTFLTDNVRIAIADSTTLRPGDSINPLIRMLPRSVMQRTLIDWEYWRDETIEGGVIGFRPEQLRAIDLNHVDLVIMNPPFTRQQLISRLYENYKESLVRELGSYANQIDKRMSLAGYFILLADKFVKFDETTNRGGRISAVLPASILRGNTSEKLREFLKKHYHIQFIVYRKDAPNFSEDTHFQEALLVIEKRRYVQNEGSNLFTTIIRVDDLEHLDLSELKKAINRFNNLGVMKHDNFSIRRISQNHLENNFFKEISVFDWSLLEIWENARRARILDSIGNLGITVVSKDNAEPRDLNATFKMMALNGPSTSVMQSDHWRVQNFEDTLVVRDERATQETVQIPQNACLPLFRRPPTANRLDQTKPISWVVARHFPQADNFERILNWGNRSHRRIDWDRWRDYLRNRTGYLGLGERLDVTSPNIHLLAWYSEKPIVWARNPAVLQVGSSEEAKVHCMWFNSTLNLLQTFIVRNPTRGGYLQTHSYIIKDMLTFSLDRLSDDAKAELLKLSNELSSEEFPSLWVQFARNINPSSIAHHHLAEIRRAFPNVEEELGNGYFPRIRLDQTINTILHREGRTTVPINGSGSISLSEFYLKILLEISRLKNIMT